MNRFKKYTLLVLVAVGFGNATYAADSFILTSKIENSITIKDQSSIASIYYDQNLDKGVLRAVINLQQDVRNVVGQNPALISQLNGSKSPLLIIGTIGTNSIIDKLVKQKKINGKELIGKREKFIIQDIKTEDNLDAIVIAGSEKRGTIYGIYEFSKQIGVSPWTYWADVPVVKKENLYFKNGSYTDGEPEVELRGIFLND